MSNTDKRLEKHTKEVIIEQIDICLSGQDPRYQLGRYVEKLREEIIHQALEEERERVRRDIEFVKTNIAWHRTQGIEADSGDDARQIGWDGACDLILSSLDTNLKE